MPKARNRVFIASAITAAALVLAGGVAVARDALAVRSLLTELRRDAASAPAMLASGDIEAARELLDHAAGVVGDAEARVDGPLWTVARSLPVLGRSAEATVRVVATSRAVVAVAADAAEAFGDLLGEDGQVALRPSGLGFDLEPLQQAAERAGSLDTRQLRGALQSLDVVPLRWVPPQVRDGVADAARLARDVAGSLERLTQVSAALPTFLGGDGPREYLLMMQNNGELRGTGGLASFFAILEADDGTFVLSEPQSYNALDRGVDTRLLDDDEGAALDARFAPVPTTPEFEARYGNNNAAGFFSNVNLDPHLPLTGQVVVDLYEERSGRQVDGLVMIDPIGMGTILAAIGPMPVPERPAGVDAALWPDLPSEVPPGDIAQFTLIDVYDAFEGHNEIRKPFHKSLALTIFREIFAAPRDAVALGGQFGRATGQRHLQLFSLNPDEQAAFEAAGIAGALASPKAGDVLAFTASNAGANKQDVHVAHHLSGEIVFETPPARRTAIDALVRSADLRVELDNPLPTSGRPDYIIKTYRTGQNLDEVVYGLNRTWFTVWAPETTGALNAPAGAGVTDLGSGAIHGLAAFDAWLETPSESSNGYDLSLTGVVGVRDIGPDLRYRQTIWRQAKGIADQLDLTYHPPAGWGIASYRVEGGGEPQGLGAIPTGDRIAGEVQPDGSLRVHGAATADVHVELVFSRSLFGRLRDWLAAPAF